MTVKIRDKEELLSHENEILEILNTDEKMKERFVEDPVSTLKEMGFFLREKFLKEISKERSKIPEELLQLDRELLSKKGPGKVNINIKFVPYKEGDNYD